MGGPLDEGSSFRCFGCGKLTYAHDSNPVTIHDPSSLFCRHCLNDLSEEEQKQQVKERLTEEGKQKVDWIEDSEVVQQ